MVASMDESTKPGPPAAAIYLLAAHPDWNESRVNRRLLERARALPGVRVCDLYERYPDFDIDVAAEQAAAAAARLLVWLHPIQWYSMPPLMKLWLDEVLRYGWAYGRGGHALRGKDLWLVASTGSPPDSFHPLGYNQRGFDAFLPPYEQTALLCGMRFLPPLVLHDAHQASEEIVEEHARRFADRLARYPDWPELAGALLRPQPQVPPSDRPIVHGGG